MLRARHLDDDRIALTAAGADCGQADTSASPAKLIDQRKQDARPASGQRMTERNRAAIDIDLVLRKT